MLLDDFGYEVGCFQLFDRDKFSRFELVYLLVNLHFREHRVECFDHPSSENAIIAEIAKHR